MATDDHSQSQTIQIEVAYALPEKQWLLSLTVPKGTTAIQAVELSGIRTQIPDLVIDPNELGVFSEKITSDTELNDGDRVEIYRPLIMDPMESRRLRAQADSDKAFKKRIK